MIALLPIVLVLLLLNTGMLQAILPAVSVGNSTYTALEFQYYFYTTYYDYVNENAAKLSDLGLDVTKKLDKQRYDETRSWQAYFSEQALNHLAEDTALLIDAEQAGFRRDAEVTAACSQRRADLMQYCMDNGIDGLDNYFRSYYKKGMTEDKYFELYENQTLAALYRETVQAQLTPAQADVTALAATMEQSLSATVSVVAAQFVPAADRTTGLAETQQWSNARQLAQSFLDRWAARGGGQTLFSEMTETYGQAAPYGFASGTFLNAFADDLDPEISVWCFDKERTEGDVILLLAEQNLQTQAYEQWLAQRQERCKVVTHPLGMALAL